MLEVELIAEYLLENSYVSSERDAYEFIPCMSDEWLGSLLESTEIQDLYDVILEMRKEDKMKGAKRPKLYINAPRRTTETGEPIGEIIKTSDGKLVKRIPTHKVPNVDITLKRSNQGMPMDPEKAPSNYNDYIHPSIKRHAHGGKERNLRGHIVVPAGTSRGVKKKRGAPIPQPESPVARHKRVKEGEKAAADIRQIMQKGGRAWWA